MTIEFPPVTLDSVIQRNPSLTTAALDDELVMLDLEQGMYYGLDDVATAIWNELVEPQRVGDVCDALLEVYDVDLETCRVDTLAFVNELFAQGLVQLGESIVP